MTAIPTLYIVSTPIGNLADMTLRAIETLKTVDIIAAEDTRHSSRLLSHYGIQTAMISLHDHNEQVRIEKIMTLLSEGKSIALISDAGTPLISDPGFRLVRAVSAQGFKVTSVPGACAAISALVLSGLPADRFIFEGFLPVKTLALKNYLAQFLQESRTVIFYESVHRIVKTLDVFETVFGSHRVITIARELTKTFETVKQGDLATIKAFVENDTNQQKGEFVIVLSGVESINTSEDDAMLNTLLKSLLTEISLKQSVKIACEVTGKSRKIVYAKALEMMDK